MSMLNRRLFLASAAAIGAAAPTARAQSQRTTSAAAPRDAAVFNGRPRNVRGKILYIGDDDKERGREWFGFTYREDRQVTLRAYCEIDDTRVQRDVVQSMDERFRPLDCFVRLHVDGKFLGTGWIRVTETEAECEVSSIELGRVHQRMPLAVPALSLVSHPLSTDSLLMAAFDHSKSERIQSWSGGLSTSPLLNGGSGPFISVGGQRSVEYVGAERATTRAGTFDTHRYRLLMGRSRDGRRPSYEIWCTHPHYIFVRGEVRDYLSNATGAGRYELVEFGA